MFCLPSYDIERTNAEVFKRNRLCMRVNAKKKKKIEVYVVEEICKEEKIYIYEEGSKSCAI